MGELEETTKIPCILLDARLVCCGNVEGYSLRQIRIPSIPTDMEVVVAELLPGRLAEDVSCSNSEAQATSATRPS